MTTREKKGWFACREYSISKNYSARSRGLDKRERILATSYYWGVGEVKDCTTLYCPIKIHPVIKILPFKSLDSGHIAEWFNGAERGLYSIWWRWTSDISGDKNLSVRGHRQISRIYHITEKWHKVGRVVSDSIYTMILRNNKR